MMKSLSILLLAAAACGSDSNPKAVDAKVFMDGSGSGGAKKLTVKNAPLATPWCSITVNGGTASTAATQTMDITTNGTITLTAAPESASFELIANMWHHTDGDTGGSGDSGTVASGKSTAMVTVSTTADKCVWVCCPFTNGTGCPTTDQCP